MALRQRGKDNFYHAYFRTVRSTPDGGLKYATTTVNLYTDDLRTARALEADLSTLFEGISLSEKRNWLLIHPEEQQPVEREENHGLRYRMILETPLDAVHLQVMLVTEGNSESCAPVSTEGDQLLYILSGRFRYIHVAERKRSFRTTKKSLPIPKSICKYE